MAENKRKYPLHTSLKGILVFPHLNVADSKYAKDGKRPDYRTKLRIEDHLFESSGWKDQLDAAAKAALENATFEGQPLTAKAKRQAQEKGLQVPYQRARDKDDNELPYYDVTFKISDGGVDPKTGEEYSNKPKMFDTSKPPKNVDVPLRNGAVVKISYTEFPWATAALGYGITLRPKGIQVIKLAPKGEADAAFYGFDGDEEDGFKADDDDIGESFNQDAGGYKQKPAEDDGSINEEEIPF